MSFDKVEVRVSTSDEVQQPGRLEVAGPKSSVYLSEPRSGVLPSPQVIHFISGTEQWCARFLEGSLGLRKLRLGKLDLEILAHGPNLAVRIQD